MSDACCCDYIPPDVCVDCGPPYTIGNTASMLLSISGFVDGPPIGYCCDLNSLHPYEVPPNCAVGDGYTTYQYNYSSGYNGNYTVDAEGGCCWFHNFFVDEESFCTSTSGPIVGYTKCWDTRREPDDHLFSSVSRLAVVRVCLTESADTVYWAPLMTSSCCFYKDGVWYPSSSACGDSVCWDLDYPYVGSISKTAFCNLESSSIHGWQYSYDTSPGATAGHCNDIKLSRITFTLHPAGFIS